MIIQTIDLTNSLWNVLLQHFHHDIYHTSDYLYVEAQRTKTVPEAVLIAENEKLFFLPYLIQRCDRLFDPSFAIDDIFDVVSPYGYPGILLNESAQRDSSFLKRSIAELISYFQTRQICSGFFRLHPILNQGFEEILSPDVCVISGETVSVDLRLSDAEIWQQTRPEHRNKINRCKRAGMEARIVPFASYLIEFTQIYQETMARVQASQTYYFNQQYFDDLAKLNKQIYLCIVEFDRQIACAGIFTECCGIVQYHLGGTRNHFLKQAPSKLMFDYMRSWSKQRGNAFLHLGGGVGSAKDSLYHFKAGFSKLRHPFLTLRLVVDRSQYNQLVDLRAKSINTQAEVLFQSRFFPCYRASG